MASKALDVKLRLSLREGSIYYFAERSLTSPQPHYFIVVNSNPIRQEVLLLSVVTSQVKSVQERRQACPETLVELAPDVLDVLKKPSIIDCNDLKLIQLADFNERFVSKEIQYFDKDLPVSLCKALRKAIHASDILSDEVKAFVEKP